MQVDGGISNSNQKWRNDKCWREYKILKNIGHTKKIKFEILLDLVVKMVNV